MRNTITHIISTKVLVYYDTVQIFVGQDRTGTSYLCMLLDDNHNYLAVMISQYRLNSFCQGNEDLRNIYVNPENAMYFILSEHDDYFFAKIYDSEITEEMLPEEGFKIKITPECQRTEEIKTEATEKRRPIIHLGLYDDNNSPDADPEVLLNVLSSYKKMAIARYKKKTKTQDRLSLENKFRVFSTSVASFNVHLFIDIETDMFGGNIIEMTLRDIDRLLNINNNTDFDELRRNFGGHTLDHYKSFITSLCNSNLGLKIQRYAENDPNGVISYRTNKESLFRAYEYFCNREVEIRDEYLAYSGTFIKIDINKKTWSFYDVDEDHVISGHIDNEEMLEGKIIATQEYMITVREYTLNDKIITSMVDINVI
ncbi:MAG: DUF6575 domain-containing protein [Marinifilaceae bacterium]